MASPEKKQKAGPGRPKLSESERKRNISARNREKRKCKVFIGVEIGRWCAIKELLGLRSHTEVAKVLIDTYMKSLSSTLGATAGPTMVTPSVLGPSSSSTALGLQHLKDNTGELSESESVVSSGSNDKEDW